MAELASFRAAIKELREQVRTQKLEIVECVSEAAPFRSALKELQEQVRSQKREIDGLTAEVGRLRTTLHGLQPARVPELVSSQPPRVVSVPPKKELFLEGLPKEQFLPWEEKIYTIFKYHLGKAGRHRRLLSQVEQLPDVSAAAKKGLPSTVTFRDWVDFRLHDWFQTEEVGQQVEIFSRISDRARQQKQEDVKAFLESLPSEEFTPQEIFLRESLVTFLEAWSAPYPPMLNQACDDPQVKQAKNELLQGGTPLYKWIEARLGEELEVKRDASGADFVGLVGNLTDENIQAAPRKNRKRF